MAAPIGAPLIPSMRHKPASVEMPRFYGDNPESWVFQAERYFDSYNISEDHKLSLASFYLDGEAREWYRWLFRNKQLSNWANFSLEVTSRFHKCTLFPAEGRLSKLRQTFTVSDFQAQFESIANETTDVPDSWLVPLFTSGLRADIQTTVLVHKRKTLDEAFELANTHEQRLLLERSGSFKPSFTNSPPLLPNPIPYPHNVNRNRLPIKRLSPMEIQQRREKGLCFRCDEKYSAGHKFKAPPQLLLLECEPEVQDLLTDSSLTDEMLAEELQRLEMMHSSSISYHAMAGGDAASALCFTGYVQGSSVQVMFDNGSTHNFIQTRVANFLHLAVEPISPFSVMVGSGQRLPCTGIVRQVPLMI